MSVEVVRFVERAVGHVLSAKEIRQAMAGWNAERTGSEAA